MLPFLKANKMASVIMAKTKPEGGISDQGEEGEHSPELLSAAEDLISAVHMKDSKAVADALLSALGSQNEDSSEDEIEE